MNVIQIDICIFTQDGSTVKSLSVISLYAFAKAKSKSSIEPRACTIMWTEGSYRDRAI